MNAHFSSLKPKLDLLYRAYNYRYLHSDPVQFVHRFRGKQNREIAGILSAAFAYGNVNQICTSLNRIFQPLGPSPFEYVINLDPHQTARTYASFIHRFNSGKDVTLLLYYLHQIYNRYSSLESFFIENYDRKDRTVEKALSGFAKRIFMLDCTPFYKNGLPKDAGVRFLVSSPEGGSACKRMNMFLRWMVRSDDGIDCGLWKCVDASHLIVPLDSHTARICNYIGLTRRKTATWNMALEVTDNLKKIAPHDPVKYDFALSRLGILDLCEHEYRSGICEQCHLFSLCRLAEHHSE